MNRRDFLGTGAVLLAALGFSTTGCGAPVAGVPQRSTTTGTASVTGGPTPIDGELRAPMARMAGPDAATAHGRFAAFAANLFRTGAPGTDNAVLSPYSVLAALGMTALGARGSTATALHKVLGGDATEVSSMLTAVDAAIADAVTAGNKRASAGDERLAVDAANSLWAQQGLDVRRDFLEALAQGYGAGLRTSDFGGNPAGARLSINSWVSEKTHSLIPTLLPDGSITMDTRIVLVNALYLKAAWQSPFDPSPDNVDFSTASGGTVQVPLMATQDDLRYAKGNGWQAVTLPYVGRKLGLTIILPDQGRFDAVAKGVDAELLINATSGETALVDVSMPAFTATSAVDLLATLTALGAGVLFESGADLSGIAGAPGDLLVSKVIHQARISVDENGTEAAAATAVIGLAGSAPDEHPPTPVDFRVDRAFLYVIHDSATATPLFIGRVSDPTK